MATNDKREGLLGEEDNIKTMDNEEDNG